MSKGLGYPKYSWPSSKEKPEKEESPKGSG